MKNMKNINKIILGLLAVSLAFTSCEDEDKDPITVHEDPDNIPAYVRMGGYETIIPITEVPDAVFNANVNDRRGNVASWDLTVQLESGGEIIAGPAAVVSLTSFPTDISFSYEDLATLMGITTADISPGDFVRFLGTSTGKDGRVWTFENFSASITGQPEQLQAYNVVVLIKCANITDATVGGTWIADLQDSYGDGWDGAFLTFEIDGNETDYTVSGGQAFGATYEIDVPDGAELIISYTSGSFEGEHTFDLTSPDGPYGSYGPAPAPCVN
jgi:hypothetical protein